MQLGYNTEVSWRILSTTIRDPHVYYTTRMQLGVDTIAFAGKNVVLSSPIRENFTLFIPMNL